MDDRSVRFLFTPIIWMFLEDDNRLLTMPRTITSDQARAGGSGTPAKLQRVDLRAAGVSYSVIHVF